MNYHKGFIAPLLLALIAILLLGGGAYVYVQNKQANQMATTVVIPADWKTYHNTKYGFKISYPSSATIYAFPLSDETLSGIKNPIITDLSGKEDNIFIRISTSTNPNQSAYICVGVPCNQSSPGYPGVRHVAPTLSINGRDYHVRGYRGDTQEEAVAYVSDNLNIYRSIYSINDKTISDQEYSVLESQLESIIKTFSFDSQSILPPVTLDTIFSAQIAFGPSQTLVQLDGTGSYIEPSGATRVVIELAGGNGYYPTTSFGDLNNDKNNDAVAVVDDYVGKNISNKNLAVWVNDDGATRYVTKTSLGTNPIINSVSIKNGVISIDIIPSDTSSSTYQSPSIWVYSLQDNSLVRTSSTLSSRAFITSGTATASSSGWGIVVRGFNFASDAKVFYEGVGYERPGYAGRVADPTYVSADGTELRFVLPPGATGDSITVQVKNGVIGKYTNSNQIKVPL